MKVIVDHNGAVPTSKGLVTYQAGVVTDLPEEVVSALGDSARSVEPKKEKAPKASKTPDESKDPKDSKEPAGTKDVKTKEDKQIKDGDTITK